MTSGELNDFFGGQIRVGAVYIGPHGFAAARSRHSDHSGLGDIRMAGEAILDFIGEDIEAADVDQFFLAVHDAEITALVHHREIGRASRRERMSSQGGYYVLQ